MDLPVGSSLRPRSACGDVRARFSLTYREDRAFIAGIVRRQGIPLGDVDDAVQDVFVVLHARLPELDERAPLRVWLRSVAVRVCQNRRRKVQRHRLALDHEGHACDPDRLSDQAQSLPDESAARSEQRAVLTRALGQLDASKRQVLVLTALEERTAAEIAELTATSPNTVSSRLRLARERLAGELGAVGQPTPVRRAKSGRGLHLHAAACNV